MVCMQYGSNQSRTFRASSGKATVNESRNLSALKNILRTLDLRDFRLYFLGQSVSLIGTWIQQIAFAWITYRVALAWGA